jgi:hypothetical protein
MLNSPAESSSHAKENLSQASAKQRQHLKIACAGACACAVIPAVMSKTSPVVSQHFAKSSYQRSPEHEVVATGRHHHLVQLCDQNNRMLRKAFWQKSDMPVATKTEIYTLSYLCLSQHPIEQIPPHGPEQE